jgi:nucleoid-associated protein EbfC
MKARLPAGYGGGPTNQKDLMRQYQKMQEQFAQTQAELEERVFTATSGGGVVEVAMNGKKELTSLTIKPEVVDPEDVEMLQDLVMAAVNEVLRNIETTTNNELGRITGGLNLGLPGML